MKIQLTPLIGIFWVLVLGLNGCSSVQQIAGSRDINIALKKSEIFQNQFTGFALYDPSEGKYLKEKNADLLFTPASNTKILTAYAALTNLPDSLPSFFYRLIDDTIHLVPLGDPTFLHPDFSEQQLISKLNQKPITLHMPPDEISAYGPGWAWDDYQYSYQVERSWLPLYGNEVRIFKKDTLQIIPEFFTDYTQIFVGEKPGDLVYREREFNAFNVWMESDTSTFERKIPFEYSGELMTKLLEDTLKQSITFSPLPYVPNPDTLYNSALVPAVALMMLRSDNFLAEQLLIVSGRINGHYNMDAYRQKLLAEWKLPTPVRWVDGSGLSRYNLISPKAFVTALDGIYHTISWEEITAIFPTGGVSGTIKNWYEGNPPYVFAKTGTLSNNHSLSGYIRTRSGRVLIFSMMNNHYLRPVNELKAEMQKLLEIIRDTY